MKGLAPYNPSEIAPLAVATKRKSAQRTPSPSLAPSLAQAMTQHDERIGTAEAARILGRTSKCVLRLAQRGHLSMDRPGGARPRFKKSEVLELAKKCGLSPEGM
jgi:excisionase family DNA binding protein